VKLTVTAWSYQPFAFGERSAAPAIAERERLVRPGRHGQLHVR